LAAILAADVVGYSRLIEADEEGTRVRLRSLLAELIQPRVAADGGRIVKTTGDGILVEFPSAVAAVRNALAIQSAMTGRDSNLPEDRRIRFRVGINVGDVIVEGDDIHGDGVNVAARLEGLCGPGEVYISAAAHDQVESKLAATFDDLGEQTLKNISKRVGVYRVSAGSGEAAVASDELTGTPSLPDKPSIAVLPFENMSGDPEQTYFSDGITEDIITELSRFPDLMVIARNSSFTYKGRAVNVQEVSRDLGVRYVLEGSVRKAGQRVRITAQLIDAFTGDHIWAERYDRDLTDIFEVQDEITQAVVANVPERIAMVELDRVKRKPPSHMSAHDYVLRGKRHHDLGTPEDNAEALRLLDKAIELDPDYAAAYAWKACTLGQAVALGCGGSPEELFARDLEAVRKGLSLDPNNIECHRILCEFGMMWSDWELAQRHHEKAFTLNPNDARIIAQRGELLTKLGDAEEGVRWVQKSIDLDPYGADSRAHLLGRALFSSHRYADAIAAFRRIPRLRPDHFADMAACFAQLEQDGEASAHSAKVLELNPNFTVKDFVERRALKQPKDQSHLRAALLKARLPE
jgi:adenylate cyclase